MTGIKDDGKGMRWVEYREGNADRLGNPLFTAEEIDQDGAGTKKHHRDQKNGKPKALQG